MISIIMQAKNDNYFGNFIQRFKFTITKHIDNIKKLGLEDEFQIVLTDWGSDIRLIDDLDIDFSLIKYIYVSPEIANKYNKDAKYSYVHPINVSARNSDGEFIMWGDSDGFLPIDGLKKIYDLSKDDNLNNSFYWGSRFHIEKGDYEKLNNIDEIDNLIYTKSNLNHDIWTEDGGAAGIYFMRKYMYLESTGFSEELIHWGWQDIEFHYRLRTNYKFGGDLESFGVKVYHLDHYQKEIPFNLQYKANSHFRYPFKANSDNWGLANEELEIIYKK